MSAPLHIAAHNGAPEWGGAEIAVTRLLLGLRDRGHQVTFFVARDKVAKGAEALGLETKRLKVGGDIALHHSLRVRNALAEVAPDVLLIGTFRKTLHLALGARMAGVPVVSRIGMSSDVPRNLKYRWAFRNLVDRIAVNTGEIRAEYLRRMPGFDPNMVEVVSKGINSEPIQPDAARRRLRIRNGAGIPEDAFVVGALARLVSEKRLDLWMEAFAQLPEDSWGLIVGDGKLRSELLDRAIELGISERICMVGHQEDPRPWLGAMDLLLITSEQEALANAMLEAMACGIPVVTTPVNGSGDALLGAENGVDPGVILPDFTAESTARVLLDLHGRRRELFPMGKAARTRISRHFSPEASLEHWETVLMHAVRDRIGT